MKKLILLLSMMFSMPAFAKDVMLMNRIGPSVSELYVSNADGTGEHKLFATTGFDYHASFSYEGKGSFSLPNEPATASQTFIVRTPTALVWRDSQMIRLWMIRDFYHLTEHKVAFVSAHGTTHRANIWILDLKTKRLRNLTGQEGIQGDP